MGCARHGVADCSQCSPIDNPKEAARERFRNVILLAGYKNPEPILEEWFEKYWNEEREKFFAMLQEYEEDYKRDGEII